LTDQRPRALSRHNNTGASSLFMDRIVKVIFLAIGVIILVAIFYRLRLYYSGLNVTSWFRSFAKNKSVEGKTFSLHLIGWAYDVIPANKNTILILNSIGFGKVIDEKTHIHAQIL